MALRRSQRSGKARLEKPVHERLSDVTLLLRCSARNSSRIVDGGTDTPCYHEVSAWSHRQRR